MALLALFVFLRLDGKRRPPDARRSTVAESSVAEAAFRPGGAEGRTSVDGGVDLDALPPERRTPIVKAAQRVTPSVVSVNVIKRERVAPRSLLEEFFVPHGYEQEVAGLGSGFAVAPGGYVLTNAHVVQGATEIVLTEASGADYPAQLVGIDEMSDIALLKADADIPVPEVGDSDSLVIGEPAIAIGNPFGYLLSNAEATVTAGVISGLGRHILSAAVGQSQNQQDQTVYADMIQTDASINPGNSGGPLVNAEGRVIGVNSAIFSLSGGFQGLGFAIPINRALRIARQLREVGHVRRPWIGVDVGPAQRGPTGRPRGASIARVAPGSPADSAGLRPGLDLVSIDGRPVKSPLDWDAELFNLIPGDTVSLTVRDARGRERRVSMDVEDLPSVRAARVEALTGLELVTLTPAIRAERGLRSQQGALIVNVSDEVSRITGLQPGDLIVRINRWNIGSADDAAQALKQQADEDAVRVYYERNGVIWSTAFRIERS